MEIGRKKKVPIIAAMVGGLVIVYVLLHLGPSLPTKGLARVTVSYRYFRPNPEPEKPGQWLAVQKKSSSDTRGLASIVAVANSGRRTDGHKCSVSAELTFHYDDGDTRSLGFLRGHKAGFFELAENGTVYRIPAQAFLDAMKALGIDESMLRGGYAVEQAVAADDPAAEKSE